MILIFQTVTNEVFITIDIKHLMLLYNNINTIYNKINYINFNDVQQYFYKVIWFILTEVHAYSFMCWCE